MHAKIKGDLGEVEYVHNHQSNDIADNGAEHTEGKTLNHKHGEDLPGQGPDRGNCADLPYSLVDGHDHDVHDADRGQWL